MVLALRLGYEVPGVPTIPEEITSNKQPCYEALEKPDRALEAWSSGQEGQAATGKIH